MKTSEVRYYIEGMCVGSLLGYLFFDRLMIALLLSVTSIIYVKYRRKSNHLKLEKTNRMRFKEMLYALTTALAAGRSMEHAIYSSYEDLLLLFGGEDRFVKSIEGMIRKIKMNCSIEASLSEFAQDLNLVSGFIFVEVFCTAYRGGGDLIQIMRETTQALCEQITLEQEIDVIITQKRYEFYILSLMVPCLLIYLRLVSPGYLERLYALPSGMLLLSVSYLLFLGSLYLGDKLTTIRVV